MVKSSKKNLLYIEYVYITRKITTWLNCTKSIFKISQTFPDYKMGVSALGVGKRIYFSYLKNLFSTKKIVLKLTLRSVD